MEGDGWGLALGKVGPEAEQPGSFSEEVAVEVQVSWTGFCPGLSGPL